MQEVFQRAVHDLQSGDGTVPASEAERLAAKLFAIPLTDQMLDIIIEQTERKLDFVPAVSDGSHHFSTSFPKASRG